MKKNNLAFGIALICLAALLTIGVWTFVRPCAHDDNLRIWLTVLGVAAATLASVTLLKPNHITKLIGAIVSILTIITPGVLVGLCQSEMMRCHTHTKPMAIVTGALSAVVWVIWLIVGIIQNKKKTRA